MLLQSHDGSIHLLPALPDEWSRGSISGLRARGGFVIESLEWENGEVIELRITSTLGGNARIRVSNKLAGTGGLKLRKAQGANPNPFYQMAKTPEPLISKEAELGRSSLPKVDEYDFETEQGKMYRLVREE